VSATAAHPVHCDCYLFVYCPDQSFDRRQLSEQCLRVHGKSVGLRQALPLHNDSCVWSPSNSSAGECVPVTEAAEWTSSTVRTLEEDRKRKMSTERPGYWSGFLSL
jgi:hypothetical protein